MTITPLNLGAVANDGNGQNLRSGGQVINANFLELDTRTSTAQAKADAAIPSNHKGVAGGVATLGADAKIPVSQLPPLAINDVFTVASQVAMLALAAERGDMAIRTDQGGQAYVLAADAPTVLANWVQIKQNLAVSLVALGAVTPAADTIAYFNGSATAAATAFTAKARALLARTDNAGMRSEIGADVTLASAVLDPQSAGGLMSATTVSGFTVFKYANGQMIAQGPVPTTANIAANTQFAVSVAIPINFPVGFVTLVGTLYPSVGNDFAIRNTQAPGTTAFLFCANGASAQSFSGNIALFGRWK